MERSWWWKTLLFGAVTVLACLYLAPSLAPSFIAEEKLPGFVKNNFKRKLQLGLDLQGGLHLVYSVNLDKAVASKVDRLSGDLEERLVEKTQNAKVDFKVTREGRDDILVTFSNPADLAKLDDEVMKNYRTSLDEVERDASKGIVRFRIDQDQVAEVGDYALRQGIETIRGRVDKFGVAEPTIIKRGTDIVVELPGLKTEDFERIKSVIGKTAQLEFKIVDAGSPYMQKVSAAIPQDGKITVVPDVWRDKKTGEQKQDIYLQSKDRKVLEAFVAGLSGELAVPADREFGYEEVEGGNGGDGKVKAPNEWRTYLLEKRAAVTGEYLSSADLSWDAQTNRPEVLFAMDHQGASLMERLTTANIGRKMAIVLDDRINSAPVINDRIAGRGVITLGGFGDPLKVQQEAKDLVAVLRSGALPAPLTKSFETQVGATMGKDVVDRALLSMLVGAIAVVLFMLVYYRVSGVIAVIAMLLNMLFMVAILAGFEASLTLPGIAGLVLTVGMAVDANIIIYERIREELRLGKTARTAVEAGFSRAFWTVFDAHVTNFTAGVVLYSYGSGPIRGFAVTLLVGIASNLFTSVWMSRWMFELLLGRRGTVKTTLSI
ncbi:MAG: protein translocase subunit SecD [Deltaproteobacteria bacterium]|nr:protein translocase subunit SecD [Deltaproteobacteria bacterium]